MTVSPYQHEARVLVHAPAAEVRERIPPTVTVEAVDDATARGRGRQQPRRWRGTSGSLGHAFTVEVPEELREVGGSGAGWWPRLPPRP